jgi:hypothetical protein
VVHIDRLRLDEAREALRLLGEASPPPGRPAAFKALRERLCDYSSVRSVLDRAPAGGRDAFVRLVGQGPAGVDELLDRGWAGHGLLPAPLDWLQRRALVVVGDDGLVHATEEARHGYLDLRLDLPEPPPEDLVSAVRVEAAGTVLVAPSAAALDRAVGTPGANLRAVAPTVAVSDKRPAAVAAALRSAGVPLADDAQVDAEAAEPALPGAAERAVGPKAIRALLERALEERRQVRLDYFASSRGGAATNRVVDPWSFRDDLLRGFCHLRSGERTFAVDRIGHAVLLPSTVDHLEGPG